MKEKSRAAVSHQPVLSRTQHPLHAAMLELVRNRSTFSALAEAVRSGVEKITPNSYDHVKLKASIDPAVLQAARDAIRSSLRKEKLDVSDQGPPRPPPSSFLYNRIQSGAKVLDVGGGDGKRLVHCPNAKNVTIVDPKPGLVEGCKAAKQCQIFDASMEPTKTVVSFNAMIQGGLAEQLEDRDGVHVIPDHDELILSGHMVKTGDVVAGSGYEDRYFPPRGEKYGPYCGVNTYAPNRVLINIGEFGNPGRPLPLFGERAVRSIPSGEATVKYAGICVKIIHDGKNTKAVRRDGALAPCTAKGPPLTLLLEVVQDSVRLLSVNTYKDFRPFHSLDELEHFVAKVKVIVKINGRLFNLKPPERVGPDYDSKVREGTVEGKVYRHSGRDVLVKHWLTFTVSPESKNTVLRVLRKRGFDVVRADGVPGVGEWQLVNYDGWHLRWLGMRPKSEHSIDTEDTVLSKLGWPFLGAFDMPQQSSDGKL